MKPTTKTGSMCFFAFSTMLLIIIDQITKQAAQAVLQGGRTVVLIRGVFELQYLENRGSAFGMMQGQRTFFLILAAGILIFIPYLYAKIPLTRHFLFLRMTAILYAAGAAGNAIDRAWQGYVVDFFYFSLIDFPIFNVADIYVTTATAALLLLILFYYKEEDFAQIRIFPKKK